MSYPDAAWERARTVRCQEEERLVARDNPRLCASAANRVSANRRELWFPVRRSSAL
jgi:hypothetical protein